MTTATLPYEIFVLLMVVTQEPELIPTTVTKFWKRGSHGTSANGEYTPMREILVLRRHNIFLKNMKYTKPYDHSISNGTTQHEVLFLVFTVEKCLGSSQGGKHFIRCSVMEVCNILCYFLDPSCICDSRTHNVSKFDHVCITVWFTHDQTWITWSTNKPHESRLLGFLK